jgi:hypothetical protein
MIRRGRRTDHSWVDKSTIFRLAKDVARVSRNGSILSFKVKGSVTLEQHCEIKEMAQVSEVSYIEVVVVKSVISEPSCS